MGLTDTGTTPLPREPVRWYTTIVGRLAIDGEVPFDEFIGEDINLVGDIWGDGRENFATNGIGGTLVFQGLPGPGEVSSGVAHSVMGGLGYYYGLRAGDVNADGYDDLWLYRKLFLGPIEGALDYETDWYAELGAGVGGVRIEGGFDADGDGNVDAVEFDDDHQAFVHYGPFLAGESRLGWYQEDAAPITRIKTDCGTGTDDENVWVRPDFFGPGRAGLALLNEESTSYYCPEAVEIFDISGSRGRYLTSADKVTYHSTNDMWPGGDHNGDGVQDLFNGIVHFGPFSGHIPFPDDQEPKQVFAPVADVHRAVGDMNGDGRPEIIIDVRRPHDEVSDWFVVPSTVLGEAIPFGEVGIPLELPIPAFASARPLGSGDLDGDGKAEIIMGVDDLEPGGRIYIWRGADIIPD